MFSRFEGLPTIALEAMSQGIPCVTYPIPGAVEACADAGYYVSSPHDAAVKVNEILKDYANASRKALAQYMKMKNCWECLKDYLTK
jgi:glycosyltransferase involved in cell wall biosynthesis